MIIKHLLGHKLFWLLLAVSWTVFVAFLCLVNNKDLPSIGAEFSGIDKFIHFLFHFVFTWFWAVYMFYSQKILTKKAIINIVSISLIFGILIELAQASFTKTRQADIFDVISNFLGAVVSGIIIYHFFKKCSRLNT